VNVLLSKNRIKPFVTPHSTFGKRLLKYKGSVLWNNLPEKLKPTEDITTFKKLLRKYITECVD